MKKWALLFMARQALETVSDETRLAALDAAALTLPRELAKIAKEAADAQRQAYKLLGNLRDGLDEKLSGQTLMKL